MLQNVQLWPTSHHLALEHFHSLAERKKKKKMILAGSRVEVARVNK